MKDLRWIRKQGKIIEKEKKRIRCMSQISLNEKLDTYSELYEIFENNIKNNRVIFESRYHLEKINNQNRINKLNLIQNKH